MIDPDPGAVRAALARLAERRPLDAEWVADQEAYAMAAEQTGRDVHAALDGFHVGLAMVATDAATAAVWLAAQAQDRPAAARHAAQDGPAAARTPVRASGGHEALNGAQRRAS